MAPLIFSSCSIVFTVLVSWAIGSTGSAWGAAPTWAGLLICWASRRSRPVIRLAIIVTMVWFCWLCAVIIAWNI